MKQSHVSITVYHQVYREETQEWVDRTDIPTLITCDRLLEIFKSKDTEALVSHIQFAMNDVYKCMIDHQKLIPVDDEIYRVRFDAAAYVAALTINTVSNKWKLRVFEKDPTDNHKFKLTHNLVA